MKNTNLFLHNEDYMPPCAKTILIKPETVICTSPYYGKTEDLDDPTEDEYGW